MKIQLTTIYAFSNIKTIFIYFILVPLISSSTIISLFYYSNQSLTINYSQYTVIIYLSICCQIISGISSSIVYEKNLNILTHTFKSSYSIIRYMFYKLIIAALLFIILLLINFTIYSLVFSTLELFNHFNYMLNFLMISFSISIFFTVVAINRKNPYIFITPLIGYIYIYSGIGLNKNYEIMKIFPFYNTINYITKNQSTLNMVT